MYLSLSVASLSAGLLFFAIALLGGRNPKTPVWASETIMGIVICPLIVGLVALGGIGAIYTVFVSETPAVKDILISCGIMAVGAACYFFLGVPKRLQLFAENEKAGEIINGDFGQQGKEKDAPSPTGKLPKAA